MTLRLMTNKTFRDITEASLMEIFPKRLKPTRRKYSDIIHSYDGQTSNVSYMDLILRAGKQDVFSISTHHPDGMFFYDNKRDAIFGVGVFFKAEAPDRPEIHIIAPRGADWAESVEKFVEKIERKIPRVTFHIKELSDDDSQLAEKHPNFCGVIVNDSNTHKNNSYMITVPSVGMRMIEENPWIASASLRTGSLEHVQLMLD